MDGQSPAAAVERGHDDFRTEYDDRESHRAQEGVPREPSEWGGGAGEERDEYARAADTVQGVSV